MNLDRDDPAALCQGMGRDEVDRVHRLLREWGAGPDNSFPVQVALLTNAQLRAAASVPRSIDDSRQWLEQPLVEYRRQAKLLVQGFSSEIRGQVEELKTITNEHAARTPKRRSRTLNSGLPRHSARGNPFATRKRKPWRVP